MTDRNTTYHKYDHLSIETALDRAWDDPDLSGRQRLARRGRVRAASPALARVMDRYIQGRRFGSKLEVSEGRPYTRITFAREFTLFVLEEKRETAAETAIEVPRGWAEQAIREAVSQGWRVTELIQFIKTD